MVVIIDEIKEETASKTNSLNSHTESDLYLKSRAFFNTFSSRSNSCVKGKWQDPKTVSLQQILFNNSQL